MKLCIDTADVEAIKRIYEHYPVDGVSTNPSILAKAKKPPFEVLHEIKDIIGDGELFVQVIAKDAEGMVKDAERIVKELGKNTIVKIPVNYEGLKAIKLCHEKGIRLLGTAVYTSMQGFLAAKAGCEYIAPYVNRINNMGFDGVQTSKDIHDMINKNSLEYSGLLAASFKNAIQVIELCKYGVKACTVSPDVFEAFLKNEIVDSAVDKFVEDFEGLVGKNKTMENL